MAATVKKQPLRQCVGCREMKEKKELLRIVHDAEGDFSIDRSGKKNGRGAYICNNADCLAKAMKSKGLERSLKVSVPKDVYEIMRLEMTK